VIDRNWMHMLVLGISSFPNRDFPIDSAIDDFMVCVATRGVPIFVGPIMQAPVYPKIPHWRSSLGLVQNYLLTPYGRIVAQRAARRPERRESLSHPQKGVTVRERPSLYLQQTVGLRGGAQGKHPRSTGERRRAGKRAVGKRKYYTVDNKTNY